MIGIKFGKVIGYSTRNKRCAICEAASRTGQAKVRCHDCRLNWSGSSKAVEPDMGKKDNPQSMLLTFMSCISILEIKVAFLHRNLVINKCAMYSIRPTAEQMIGDSGGMLPYLRPPVFIVGTHADKPF